MMMRNAEILALSAAGLTSAEIARELNLTIGTVTLRRQAIVAALRGGQHER